MTENRCWLEYKSDRALQRKINDGWFSDDGRDYLPISHFPPPPTNAWWVVMLKNWCELRGIKYQEIEGTTIVARAKRDQIRSFIEFAYGDDPSYHDPEKMLMWKGRPYLAHHLLDLKAFVAQELSPRLWYEIRAYAD